jgi:CheY-like chemotaxis protein
MIAAIQDVMREELESQGLEVLAAIFGRRVPDASWKRGSVDVIIMDMRMPG